MDPHHDDVFQELEDWSLSGSQHESFTGACECKSTDPARSLALGPATGQVENLRSKSSNLQPVEPGICQHRPVTVDRGPAMREREPGQA